MSGIFNFLGLPGHTLSEFKKEKKANYPEMNISTRNDLLELFTNNIKNSKKLKISKFGSFILREKKARMGRNPKTKISSIINQRKVISFKASKEFKNLINEIKDE